MTKLWTKFKRWLIRKLGGYPDAPTTVQEYVVKSVVEPVRLSAAMRIPCDIRHVLSDTPKRDMEEQIKRQLVYKIADEIVKGDLMVVKRMDDILGQETTYRADLSVIRIA